MTALAVYQAWKQQNYSTPWCFENFIQARSMKRAQDVRKQLLAIMDRYRLEVVSCGRAYNQIRKAICSGFFANAAKRDPQEGYKTLQDDQTVFVHPSSALFGKNPEWVIYHELVLTTREVWISHFSPLACAHISVIVHARSDSNRAQVADRAGAQVLQTA